MTYATQAKIAQDPNLRLRVAAALATEGVLSPLAEADALMWSLAVVKGWDTAVETAEATTGTLGRPGGREDVITDRMIRQAVRAALGSVAP